MTDLSKHNSTPVAGEGAVAAEGVIRAVGLGGRQQQRWGVAEYPAVICAVNEVNAERAAVSCW